MAFRKQCDLDDCGKILGNGPVPFLQFHGSMSEQIEREDGDVTYRYLTPHARAKLAFCDSLCLVAWIEDQQTRAEFTSRVIPTEGLY